MPLIYALTSIDGLYRYIGQTSLKVDQRLRNHLQHARGSAGPFAEWLLREQEQGTLRLVVLNQNPADADIEERMLIRKHRDTLFNIRAGGRFSPRERAARPLRPICLEADGDGVLITCPSLPEVTTFERDPSKIIRRANDAIEEALYARAAAEV